MSDERRSGRFGPLVIRQWPVNVVFALTVPAVATPLWLIVATSVPARALVPSGVAAIGVVMTLSVRALLAALIVDESAITIRNMWHTSRWCWSEVGLVGWKQPVWNVRGSPLPCQT